MADNQFLPDLEQLSREDLLTQQRELTNLLNSQEWGRFLRIADQQAEIRKNIVVFSECGSMEDCMKQEFVKGEIHGLYFMRAYLPTLVEAMGEELSRRPEKEIDEDA